MTGLSKLSLSAALPVASFISSAAKWARDRTDTRVAIRQLGIQVDYRWQSWGIWWTQDRTWTCSSPVISATVELTRL
jgi:hypothetical protein